MLLVVAGQDEIGALGNSMSKDIGKKHDRANNFDFRFDVPRRLPFNPEPQMNCTSITLFRLYFAIELTLTLCLCGCTDLPMWAIVQRKAELTDFKHFDNATIKHTDHALPLEHRSNTQFILPGIARHQSFDATMERAGTVSFIVLQHGKIIAEHYYNGFRRDSLTTSFSMAKSFVSALVGIAIHEEKIANVDESITHFLPELLRNDPRFAQITLRNLLEMRSGILFDDREGVPWSDAAIYYLTDDLRSKLANLKIERAPDHAYHYNSGDTELLGMIIQRATGIPLPIYFQEKIWRPMGAEYDASWSLDSAGDGITKAFCCINARAIDFARFGLLYLNNGKSNGQQIVPAEWVKASTEIYEHAAADTASRWNIENIDRADVAYFTWHWRRRAVPDGHAVATVRPTPDFYAEGLLGQLIYIAPKQDMVIVRIGKRWGDVPWVDLFSEIARLNPG